MPPKPVWIKCAVPSCDRKRNDSHGMCGMHARRVDRYGDPNYKTPESVRIQNNRLAQPNLGKAKKSTYKKYFGRHEHRVVAERMIGRKLKPGEIVHHIDHNKHNNSPSNLQIMTQADHARLHFSKHK